MKLTTATLPAVIACVLTRAPGGIAQDEARHALDGRELIGPGGGRSEVGREDALDELVLEAQRLVGASGAPARPPGPGAGRRRAQRGAAYALTRGFTAAPRAARGPNALLPKFMMCARPTALKSVVNFGHQLPVLPRVGLEPVVAGLVPLGEERVGRVQPLAVPRRRHHVGHLAELHRARSSLPSNGIRHVVHAQRAVAEGVDVDLAVVGRDADVHWEIGADLGDVLGRPRPVLLLVDEHQLAGERRRRERVVVVRQERPAQLERRARARAGSGAACARGSPRRSPSRRTASSPPRP